MICHWVQKLLGYHCNIVHRSNNMMVDVDALTRRFRRIFSHHISIASLLISRNQTKHPCAYAAT